MSSAGSKRSLPANGREHPGAVPVPAAVEGLDHPAVHALRTVPDVDALRDTIQGLLADRQTEQAARAVVIGAGFIDLEGVETLTSRGEFNWSSQQWV